LGRAGGGFPFWHAGLRSEESQWKIIGRLSKVALTIVLTRRWGVKMRRSCSTNPGQRAL
jgi:hypothetical protein